AVPGGDPAGFASATPSEAGGTKQYVQFLDGSVVGVDAETGRFLWRYDRTGSGPANISTPVIDGKLTPLMVRRENHNNYGD
ncbi:MAG: PQQ-binding-like beta-propeller repeat protein, partial [Moorea sp. SIO3E2]|nr:PQQ-binding-like beta-propeller repeat protein [Moorena sp. SIO3E2]